MAHPVAVILVVGLNRSLIGDHSPHLQAFADKGIVRTLQPVLPAVTCSVQASMLTGLSPGSNSGNTSGSGGGGHGIVGNGFYNRELAEVNFWKQSNHLVSGEKVWETAKTLDPTVTCANLFWWFNMYSSVNFSVTPRPIYKADGRKIPDVYTQPPQLRHQLQGRMGTFPLFYFWGPASSIQSSRWIADAALYVHQKQSPTLTLVYLPHLDYALQKLGPGHEDMPHAVAEIDAVVGDLLDYFNRAGVRVMIVSEYGIEPVTDAVHINQMLRQADALRVREEQGLELLDAGASDAFAVADHQVAHVYVRDGNDVKRYERLCSQLPGVDWVLDRTAQARIGLDHPRSGDLVLVAKPGKWFSYRYWLDDRRAPDFARTVDIHRKPGYDPLELFIDPAIRFPKLRIARRLFQKKLGMRALMDVIPLDTTLVKGSHGRVDQDEQTAPLLITEKDYAEHGDTLPCQQVRNIILEQMFSAKV